jgi:hypothetical protein
MKVVEGPTPVLIALLFGLVVFGLLIWIIWLCWKGKSDL